MAGPSKKARVDAAKDLRSKDTSKKQKEEASETLNYAKEVKKRKSQ